MRCNASELFGVEISKQNGGADGSDNNTARTVEALLQDS